MTRGERALVKSVEHGLQALCAEVGARWDESRVWFWSGEDAGAVRAYNLSSTTGSGRVVGGCTYDRLST